MKGISRITVTNQTAQEAFQEYFDKRSVGKHDKVTWVSAAVGGSKFDITVEEQKETTK